MNADELMESIIKHCDICLAHHKHSLEKFEAENDGSQMAWERIGFQKGRIISYHDIKKHVMSVKSASE
jgi:AhpD family alkylhydroperoxidase